MCNNYAVHRRARTLDWLAKRLPLHLHFAPTYSFWPNQVGRWFALITHHGIRKRSLTSAAELSRKIVEFVDHYNQHAKPFR